MSQPSVLSRSSLVRGSGLRCKATAALGSLFAPFGGLLLLIPVFASFATTYLHKAAYDTTGGIRVEWTGRLMLTSTSIHPILPTLSDSRTLTAFIETLGTKREKPRFRQPPGLIQRPNESYTMTEHLLKRASAFSSTSTFLVGAQETHFSLHQSIVGALSKPLMAMMKNGMRESVSNTCKLPDTDPETFVLFLEFAYHGIYRASPETLPTSKPGNGKPTPVEEVVSAQKKNYCCGCGFIPPSNQTCQTSDCKQYEDKYCSTCRRRRPFERTTRPYLGGRDHYHPYDACTITERAVNAANLQQHKRMMAFPDLEFPAGGFHFRGFREWLSTLRPPDKPTNHPIIHAKLYVFAIKYLIEPLQEHCLQKLHRDISTLHVEANAKSIIELFRYSYAETSPSSTTGEGIGYQLRTLSAAYANWKVKALYKSAEFGEFLEAEPDFARMMVIQQLA